MASGDGLLVRVRASTRALRSAELRALAELASCHGNGIVELTRRANLQLRGVSEPTLAPLTRALVEAGLVHPEPDEERRRVALITDPLAGLAHGVSDVAPFVHGLVEALAHEAAPHAAKFALTIAGNRRSLLPGADVQLVVLSEVIELHIAHEHGSTALGSASPEHVIEALRWLLASVAQTRSGRVHEIVKGAGIAALEEALGAWFDFAVEPLPAYRSEPTIGFFDQRAPWLGIALPFGSGTSVQWHAVAELAERFGDGSVRVTPERVLLLPHVSPSQQGDVLAWAEREGFIGDPRAALLRVAACVGAPRCAAALGETRALAGALSTSLAPGATLHVSGCGKGCAASGPATFTLVRAPDGCKVGHATDVLGALSARSEPEESVRARLARTSPEVKVSASMRRTYPYERDPAAIYRQSFAIIRAEAELARFTPGEERVAVRLIHTSGSVDLAPHIVFTPGFTDAAESALRRGAPILCDANMIVSGVTRSRLSASNDVLCFLDHPSTPALAKEQRTTRSAAALTHWRDRLDGAVVAIGNAPTALFRLLELFDETDARPAAIIGLPVGFVGAVESKEALVEDGRVPSMIVRGRRGGSALAVAAINALASSQE
jgi:precorrin isomerase/dissimilatory sulfite reductase (desulfoviridin) alpha/beta subunit